MALPKLGDWTPSDAKSWLTLWHEDTPNVVPLFGPKHALSIRCWCHPVRDEVDTNVIWHNAAH